MYRIEDIDKINLNINKIKDIADEVYKKNNEPTLDENSLVYKCIMNYIITKKKIVYGGTAQNLLIVEKNKNDSFYRDVNGVYYNWPEIADIEFYSPTPIKDAMELSEELYNKNFKNIDCKEGINSETYKIFVNFINYCDISYMPINIYSNLPTITVNNIICASPYFMALDAYRVLTDPLTSYWRLEKSIFRFQKILSYYPFDKSLLEKKIFLNKYDDNVKRFIRKNIIHNSKLILVGYYAYNYYIKKACKEYIIKNFSYYEAITTNNFLKDAQHIYKILKKKYKNNIKTKEFYPFFSFLDKRIEYYYDNILIFILYGNNNRCTVYNYSKKKKTHFGTFNLVLMYLLFNYYYYIINKLNNLSNNNSILISKFFYSRNIYLDKHNITVIDKSPFQDFTMNCYGDTIDPRRLSFLDKKKKFKYNPTGKISKLPIHNFNNNSGNQILNEKYLILKKKK
jgi:hypothetical protein